MGSPSEVAEHANEPAAERESDENNNCAQNELDHFIILAKPLVHLMARLKTEWKQNRMHFLAATYGALEV